MEDGRVESDRKGVVHFLFHGPHEFGHVVTPLTLGGLAISDLGAETALHLGARNDLELIRCGPCREFSAEQVLDESL